MSTPRTPTMVGPTRATRTRRIEALHAARELVAAAGLAAGANSREASDREADLVSRDEAFAELGPLAPADQPALSGPLFAQLAEQRQQLDLHRRALTRLLDRAAR